MQDARCRIKCQVIPKVGAIFPILTSLLLLTSIVLAQGSLDLSWHVVAGGGGQMQSAGHTLMGTIGQPSAGTMSGSSSTLCSGFWCGAIAEYRIYLPLTAKNYPPLIFSDDFNDGTLTGWTSSGGTWTNLGSYMQGVYLSDTAWNMKAVTGTNVVYEGKVNLLSGYAVGLVFRSSANGTSSYAAILDTVQGFKISRYSPHQILVSYPMTVQYNHWYTIQIVADGSTLEAYLDGVKRLTATDTTYAGGQLGVMLHRATAAYDDLQAWATP
jgi:hypothetical protein